MLLYRNLLFVLVPLLVALDQATKAWIRHALPADERGRYPKITVIEGFFNINHAENPGAAWGLLANNEYRMVFFTLVTIGAVALILSYWKKLHRGEVVLASGLACVFAGAIGNFIDRLMFRQVTDFLQFYASGSLGGWLRERGISPYFPSFNVADICINVGVGLFVIHVLFLEKRLEAARAAAAVDG